MNPYDNWGRPNPHYTESSTGTGYTGDGWNYSNGYSVLPGRPDPPKKKKGGAGKALGAVALVLVCALGGFGGSYVANQYFPPTGGETVVYKAQEQQPTPVSYGEELSVTDIAAKAVQSVVSITTENMVSNPFMGEMVLSGAGSGVILSEDGTIITNNHVVTGAHNIRVTLEDGSEYDATLVGADANTDIAVIKIDATGLSPATIGNSSELEVGEFCIAVGNPMGSLGGTVTDGIISALDRELTIDDTTMNLLQMSAAISPGNSGGGLFDAAGNLIGIVNAKAGGEDTEGLSFAIPINTAMDTAEQLITNGRVTGRAALGITAGEASADNTLIRGSNSAAGVYVESVTPGGGAGAAGMQAGDRILSVGDRAIAKLGDISYALSGYAPGDTATVVVERGGSEMTFEVLLGELST